MRLILLFMLAIFSLSLSLSSQAQQQKYVFDPNHTYVHWQVDHFGFSKPSGKWLAEGTILVDEAKPEESKLDVKIKLANLVTGIPKFDSHLKSTDFFDVAKYPIATFKSDQITKIGNDTAQVRGMLTLHGVTKPVTLEVKLNRVDISPVTQKKTAGFTASTTINRSDFGLGKFAPGVSDEVKVNIEAEAQLAADTPESPPAPTQAKPSREPQEPDTNL